jgi:hypothetical protein
MGAAGTWRRAGAQTGRHNFSMSWIVFPLRIAPHSVEDVVESPIRRGLGPDAGRNGRPQAPGALPRMAAEEDPRADAGTIRGASRRRRTSSRTQRRCEPDAERTRLLLHMEGVRRSDRRRVLRQEQGLRARPQARAALDGTLERRRAGQGITGYSISVKFLRSVAADAAGPRPPIISAPCRWSFGAGRFICERSTGP